MASAPGKRTVLERVALRLFRRWTDRHGPVASDDVIHTLRPEQRTALRRIQRAAVTRAAIAGGLCGLVAAVVEVSAAPLLAGDAVTWSSHLRYWLLVGGVTGAATVLELAFLYWDSMRTVHRLSRAAELELFDGAGDETDQGLALARAALELPYPSDAVVGIDPHREVSRARVLVAALLYKAKVSLTNFVLKSVIRRLMGRAALRAWSAFVAIPVIGLWNAVVSFRVAREARIRIMGPTAARELLDRVLEAHPRPSPGLRLALLRAVGGSIVRSRRLHPNHVALLEAMREHFEVPAADRPLDDCQTLLTELPGLADDERRATLSALTIAIIIDGRIDRRELDLLREAHAAAERPFSAAALRDLHARFLAGDPLDASALT